MVLSKSVNKKQGGGMLCFYLNELGVQWLKGKKGGNSIFNELKVLRHSGTSKMYIAVEEDPLDPTAVIPNIPKKYIEHVTFRDCLLHAYGRSEGLYADGGGAVMMVKYTIDSDDYCYLIVTVKAPTLRALQDLYLSLRRGQIAPCWSERWDGKATEDYSSGIGLDPPEDWLPGSS